MPKVSEVLMELKENCLRAEGGKPLYRLIHDKMENMILSGFLPDRFRLPPDTQISKNLGINHITVGKALNELRKKGLLERNRSKGTFVASPARHGMALPERGRKVTVIFDSLSRETFSTEPFITLHEKLEENNLEMIFVSSGGRSANQFEQIRAAIVNPDCCGALVWSILNEVQAEAVMRLKPIDFALIFMGHSYRNVQYPYDASIYDHYGSSREIAKRFLRNRYQKAVFFCRHTSLEFDSAKLRYQALLDMMLRYGLSPGNLTLETYMPNAIGEAGKIDFTRLIRRKDDSLLIAAHDTELNELFSQLQSSGHDRKEVFPVVTFALKGRERVTGISTMLFDISALAVNAVELLCRRLCGDRGKCRTVVCKAEYIDRNSASDV